ncbi:MAG: oxygenase MpaB family protein [Bdellovibrionota bacterium]
MTVSRQDLERHLEKLVARVKDPEAGLFGPGSMLWEVNKEAAVFLGGGRAALLQTAHPFIAHAVDQHSKTKTNPAGRFQRTFANIFSMVFGPLDTALKSSRRVHALHQTIIGKITENVGAFREGSPYEANNEEALLWVHATLWDTSMQVYERVFRKLSADEKDRYYEETKLFAYLFGIPDSILPPNWNEFMEYNEKMWNSEILTVGKPALELSHFLLSAPKPALEPVMAWYRVMTAGLLPERIRHQYRLPYGRAEERIFDASIRTARLGVRALPVRFRYLPAYVDAHRRLAGRSGPDRIGRVIDWFVLTTLKGERAAA